MFISLARPILLSVVKNPTKRLAIKRELLSLRHPRRHWLIRLPYRLSPA